MRVSRQISSSIAMGLLWFGLATFAVAQGSYRAQLRGVVTDASGAVVVHARVTITDVGTNISSSVNSDEKGEYYFTGLRPSTYTVKAEAPGFRPAERTNVVLAVDQQSSLNFTLATAGVSTTVQVTTTAPLLDTESATLGTDITGQYVKELPLLNRDFFGLTFLAGGVTETAGSGIQDNYPTGTNFVSNGQRNATAEIRIDGALITAPEQGEGGNTNVYYEPLIEGVQEFKVQNSLFSAEFGNNGGTVVNMVLKSGTNSFHGSGWYFLQRPQMDARDFFNPEPNPKPDSRRDQGGFSLGGPIVKNRTFFFVDFEKVATSLGFNNVATVPTMAERALNPDFSGTATLIYDPTKPMIGCPANCQRPPVPNNIIPAGEVNPIGRAILNLYPQPNLTGEFNNFLFSGVAEAPDYQFDIKVDHQINDSHRISARYSRSYSNYYTPEILGDAFDNNGTGDGIANTPTTAQNGSLEHTWTINPRLIWTNHFSVDRVYSLETSNIPTIASFNAKQAAAGLPQLPPVFEEANGIDRMPQFYMSGAALASYASTTADLFDQCCINTTFAHTLYSYSSQLVVSRGPHLIKFGGEQRLFFNNFFQPTGPTGTFNFTDYVTSPTPNSETAANGTTITGNPFASLLFGYADNVNPTPAPTGLIVLPSVANKSKETGFYVQDDWKVNSKLTLNLGLRYEWSTPYNERNNHIQFSDFTGQSGFTLNQTAAQAALAGIGVSFPSSEALLGTTLFPTPSMRNVPVYRNDIGPRLGFAYGLDAKTVVRGGAGIYFGMSPATNFQYPGTAFSKTATMFFTQNNFVSQYASLDNPFPAGFTGPQGTQYGAFANWGYTNANDLGTTAARDADIYQWNLGLQRELPSQIVLGIDYVANRSTHLPWSGTNNRDFMSSTLLAKVSAAEHHYYDITQGNGVGQCDSNSCVSSLLSNTVNNPFYPLFSVPCTPQPPAPCFNQPDSLYSTPQLPLGYLLDSYPQFAGDFEGLMIEEASSWYNAMQIRFQKRTTHHISFEGSYTVAKSTDDSSAGRNNWVGSLGNGLPQQLDRLYLEHAISANDTPQRLAAAVVVDLPIGRNELIGGDMNRVLDAFVGGWSINALVTQQSGQPIAIADSFGRLANGSQRPNVVCSQLKSGYSMKQVALTWQSQTPLSYFNGNCFADPGDQIPGNAPRYFPGLRVDGIHNIDTNLSKSFVPKEGTRLELRAEIFNLFNHPRFAMPNNEFLEEGFGSITSDAAGYLPRYFQFGLRFEF
ncbi:MAG TPA: carboxypeptidase regulatory-like domain-containing protein [Terriglobales bacterium]|nr:carboxypeptidase regulatory-like domain-containing protein [Terriglobales bacterium]